MDDIEIWSDLGKLYFIHERDMPELQKPYQSFSNYWFEKAASMGEVNCMWHLVGLFENDEDWDNALQWQIKAAKAGHELAQEGLVCQHEHGDLYERVDEDEIFGWYVWSAEQGKADSQYALGEIYSNSDAISHDRKQAAFWYKKAAEQGHLEAQFWLGWTHIRNIDELFDVKLGLQYFKSSAEAGYVPSMVWLGRRYMYGSPPFEEKDRDYKQAFYWYRKAAEQGDTEAKKALVRLLLKIKDKNT